MLNQTDNLYQITLLRHAESIGNANGYHQGQAEFPLTDRGRLQAQALATYWQDHGTTFDQIIASPQSRTRETAEIIAAALQKQIEYDPVWKERDNGVYAGDLGKKLFFHSLNKTAGDDDFFDGAASLAFKCVPDYFDRLGLCRFDKSAGIDNHNISIIRLVCYH